MASPRIYDRVRSFGGGMDAYRPASEIDANQSQYLENMVVLDNFEARTRPGADALDTNRNVNSTVQGMFYYTKPGGTKLLVMAQNGHLYTWNGAAWSAALTFNLHDAVAKTAFAQGVDKLFLSDGVSNPQIWDGTNFTDSGGAGNTNAPIGCTILAWHAGRMFASGVGTAPDTVYCSNFLNFTPTNWQQTTQSFRVGDGDGEAIIGMASLQNFILAVLKENSVWLVDCTPSTQPANWSAQELGQRVAREIGCVGRDAWCTYQNDLLFMSPDGVQSMQRIQAAAAAGQYQLAVPLSRPMQPYIDRINWSQQAGIVGCRYRHLALFFVPLDNSLVNNYVLVWNGRLLQWTGVWTNWTPTCAAVTRFQSLRLVVGDSAGKINQWKDYQDINTDSTYLDNGAGYASKLWTRALVFGNYDLQKKLRAALLRFNAGNATVKLSANLDLTDDETWDQDLEPSGDILPAILPMLLSSNKPTPAYRSLEDLPYCDEVFLKIESNTGWWALRNFVLSGFMKRMKSDEL